MKVCFVYSNRSESAILNPYIKYFKEKTDSKVFDISKKVSKLDKDRNLAKVFEECYDYFLKNKFQYVIVLGDRRELPFIALASFYLDIGLVHIAAGEIVKDNITYDQKIRPIVSIISDLQITFSKESKHSVEKLYKSLPYLKSNSHFLGNPIFKNITKTNLKPILKEKYDLVLIHPQSLSKKNTIKDINQFKKNLKDKKTIFISGNKDKNYELIEEFYKKIKKENKKYEFYNSLPTKKYFRLVKYCDTYYTNSSSISEIIYLNKKCLHLIGKRNKGRLGHSFNNKSPESLYKLIQKDMKKKIDN